MMKTGVVLAGTQAESKLVTREEEDGKYTLPEAIEKECNVV
jgi:hypothetical protein